MAVHAALTGAFPRSEELVAATRDLDRGRASAESVEEKFQRGERDVLALEQRLGLDLVTGGYQRWADLFRPFAEGWRGFTVGPVTRWFETNTFYRQPILHAPPERVAGVLRAALPTESLVPPGKLKVLLPGPYTFAGLWENRSGETREALTHRLGRLFADEVRELTHAGYRNFQFQEPLLVVDPPSGPLAEATVAAYRSIGASAHDGTTSVWTFFGDAVPILPLLHRLPVGAIGIDLSETEPERLRFAEGPHALGLGVIDPRTTLPEEPAEVAKVVELLSERHAGRDLWLGPGGPLDLLPAEPAARKAEVLPATRRLLEGVKAPA